MDWQTVVSPIGLGSVCSSNSEWEKIRRQLFSFSHQHGTLNYVLQFAYVARPRVRPETAPRFRGDGTHFSLVDRVKMRHEMIGEECNAAGTLSKSRHMNMENVKTIEQVLPEFFLFD